MNVRRVGDEAGLAALREPWGALLERSPVASVFMSWEWLSAWWRHYGAPHRLAVLVAEDGGRVAGILPTYVRRERVFRAVPYRLLRFLGTGGDTAPDDLDALLDPDLAPQAAAALARHVLDAEAWDALRLTDMAGPSPFRAALGTQVAGKALLAHEDGESARISYLDLPASWEAYLQAQHRDRRAKLRRERRVIEALPGARFFVWDDPATLDAAIDRLIELHRMRWQGRADQHAFSSQAYNRFHREAMRDCLARGWLRLYCLAIDGAVAAMLYCYRFRGIVFHFQGGFDPAYGKVSPGQVLMGYAIEHAIGEGSRGFDMLRGEYGYKTSWAPQRRLTHYVEAYRRTPGGLAACARHEWLPSLRRRLAPRPGDAPQGAERADA